MKKLLFLHTFIVITMLGYTQSSTIFPGLSESQKQQLLNTKIAVPLPTWIPHGFSVTKVVTKTGRSIRIENRILTIVYGRKSGNGSALEFTIDAGFDGIGSLDYEGETVKSKAGNITLYYEPYEDIGDNKKVKQWGLIQTEWFDIKNLAFNVNFSAQSINEKLNRTKPKISKTEAKKILQSMHVLK